MAFPSNRSCSISGYISQLIIGFMSFIDFIVDDYFDYLQGDLPEVAKPFSLIPEWRLAFIDCAKRISLRLAKGIYCSPNCAGEEMVLD
jgi:hypothetical protein